MNIIEMDLRFYLTNITYATATGRIPAAGNNTAKSIPATSYYRFHLFLIRRNTEKGAACQKAVP